jgi:hypothetical protein
MKIRANEKWWQIAEVRKNLENRQSCGWDTGRESLPEKVVVGKIHPRVRHVLEIQENKIIMFGKT